MPEITVDTDMLAELQGLRQEKQEALRACTNLENKLRTAKDNHKETVAQYDTALDGVPEGLKEYFDDEPKTTERKATITHADKIAWAEKWLAEKSEPVTMTAVKKAYADHFKRQSEPFIKDLEKAKSIKLTGKGRDRKVSLK